MIRSARLLVCHLTSAFLGRRSLLKTRRGPVNTYMWFWGSVLARSCLDGSGVREERTRSRRIELSTLTTPPHRVMELATFEEAQRRRDQARLDAVKQAAPQDDDGGRRRWTTTVNWSEGWQPNWLCQLHRAIVLHERGSFLLRIAHVRSRYSGRHTEPSFS